MIKIIGALMIVCGTAAWGLGSVIKMRNRVSAVKSLAESMDIMRDEICVNLAPVTDVLKIMADTAGKPASEFYGDVYSNLDKIPNIGFFGVWMQALDESVFENEERDVLIRLGAGLGKYDFESQGRIINTAKKSLKRIEEKAEAERAVNSKIHAFLGVAAGMMAVVVLF